MKKDKRIKQQAQNQKEDDELLDQAVQQNTAPAPQTNVKAASEAKEAEKDHALSQFKEYAPVFKIVILALIALLAFAVRIFSVIRFESVIHEFDPWFNFRTTKYLA